MIDVPQLHAFEVVARTGSFSRAAKELRVQQPAVSKAIGQLERELGARLFERRARGVAVTAVGARLVDHARRVLEELRVIAELPHDERAAPRGDLVIATSDHIATYLLPPVLLELARAAPAVVPRVRTGAAESAVEGIAGGNIALGLFFKLERDARIERRTVGKVPCQLIVAPEHKHDSEVLCRFIGSREIDDPSNKHFPTLKMLTKKRPRTRIALSCTSLEAHKAFVRAGVGVSILPRFVFDRELQAGAVAIFEPAYTYWASLEIAVARGRVQSPAARLLSRIIREHLSRLSER